jgi:DNA-binding NarL/FixJ family response regulator
MNDQRVLIADDHPVSRRGLRAMLETEPWVAEILEADTEQEAIRAAVTGQADLAVLDIQLLDGGDGITAARQLAKLRPQLRVMILTYSLDEADVERALRTGVAGYLRKDTPPEATIDAIRTVAGGGFVLGPQVGTALLAEFRSGPATRKAPFDQLTEREVVILAGLTEGDSNARIARKLGVSEKTVSNQMGQLFDKIGATGRVHAALLAQNAGIHPA